MAIPISNVTRRTVYAPSGAGGAGPYSFTFEILANTDIAVFKDDTLLTLTTHYTVVINANGTGSVTITAAGLALTPTSPTQYAIVGNRTISRSTDFTTGGDFFANTLNDELDQQTIFAQQNAEGVTRALQAPQTDPTTIDMTLPRSSVRAGKVLSFDASGNPSATEFIGSNRGNWATGTLYFVRDIVKDTSTSNIFQVTVEHTSVGAQPLTTNAEAAKYFLLVDAAAAGASATAAAASASAAATSASGASTSATNAASSASTASTQASNASTSATNASNSATAASSSATTASTAATNAGNSATSASTSATNASNSATSASGSASTATTQASNASTSATNAAASASTATTQATNASTSASGASTSASNASTSASNASTSATAAAASAASAAASFDAFDDIYLGAKASDPTVDNDGNALTTGDQYFNTTANELRVWNGSTWQAASTVGGTVTSLNVTGVASFADGSAAAPSITNDGDTNTGIFFPAADTIAFTEGGVESMRINSSGNVGIGTTSGSARLNVNGGTSTSQIRWEVNNAAFTQEVSTNAAANAYVYKSNDASYHVWKLSNTEAMRIDSSGRLLVNSSSARANLFNSTTAASLQIEGTTADTSSVLAVRDTDTAAAGPFFILARARGTTVGSTTVVQNGDVAGSISFQASDGTEFVETARIQSIVDGTPGANDMPGALLFSTTTDGGSSSSERMRIDASGNLGIGTSSPSGKLSTAVADGSTNAFYAERTGGSTATLAVTFANAYSNILASGVMTFSTAATERARIDSSGNLLVGTTNSSATAGNGLKVTSGSGNSDSVSVVTGATTNAGLTTYQLYSTGASAYRFYVGAGGTVFATSIAITAISDQRLKENVRDIDTGLNSIMALKPRRFDWKAGKGQDKKDAAGFIAQEFETVFPECVGTAKAGEDGIEYKNINHETLIPTLVKAMQEQQALITALTTRITALESI